MSFDSFVFIKFSVLLMLIINSHFSLKVFLSEQLRKPWQPSALFNTIRDCIASLVSFLVVEQDALQKPQKEKVDLQMVWEPVIYHSVKDIGEFIALAVWGYETSCFSGLRGKESSDWQQTWWISPWSPVTNTLPLFVRS